MNTVKNITIHTFLNVKSLTYLELFNSLNAELNPIRHLLAFVGARHILHVNRVRVKRCLNRMQKKNSVVCTTNEGNTLSMFPVYYGC